MDELRNQNVSIVWVLASSSVSRKQLLCFVHGQDQKRKQKHTTKKFTGFHNHSFYLLCSYRPHSQGNPSNVIFRSVQITEIPEGFKNSQCCDADFAYEDSSNGVTQNHLRNERGIKLTLSVAEELDVMSKNNVSIR